MSDEKIKEQKLQKTRSLLQSIKNNLDVLSKDGIEDFFLDPAVIKMLSEILFSFLGIIGGWFKGRKRGENIKFLEKADQIIANQEKQTALAGQRLSKLEAIEKHLKETCFTEEEVRKLIGELKVNSGDLEDVVADSVRNELSHLVFKSERKEE